MVDKQYIQGTQSWTVSSELIREILLRERRKGNSVLLHKSFIFSPAAYRIVFEQLTTESYAIKAHAISSSLTEFTVCLFVKWKDTNSNSYQCVYSYAEASGYVVGNAIYVCLNTPNIEINVDNHGYR